MATNRIPERLLLLLLLHHGDPPPDKLTAVDQLVLFEALNELAGRLANTGLRQEIQGFTMKAIGSIAQELGK